MLLLTDLKTRYKIRMDTENELKYLLPLSFNQSALTDWTMKTIMQGYLVDATSMVKRDKHGKPVFSVMAREQDGTEIYFETNKVSEKQFEALSQNAKDSGDGCFILPNATRIRNENGKFSITYKQDVDGELIEVEDDKNVTAPIFEKFKPHATDFVNKTRFKQQINDEEWIVDYLKTANTDDIYFVQSEVEMPYGRGVPLYMPNIISDNFIHAVDRNDLGFTNQKLSNAAHAKSLYKQYS
jgi:hypothetical protein